MLNWTLKHPRATFDMLGYIPQFLHETDPRPAREQIDTAYQYGGGWTPFEGFKMTKRGLEYPGDPPMVLIAEATLRDETLRFYDCSWLAIVQPDGSFEACRLD
jgi:hypothetical protein